MENSRFPYHVWPEGPRNGMENTISVIGPCYNDRQNIASFVESVTSILDKETYDYEILMVNDGSTDGSGELLEKLKEKHPCLRPIHLVRNFGQQAAMLAGIAEAKGEVLVTMDTDLQHPAESIPQMIRQWEEGADVVYAVPEQLSERRIEVRDVLSIEKQRSIFKINSSAIYQSVIKRFEEPGQTYVSTDFRLFDRCQRLFEDYRSEIYTYAMFLPGCVPSDHMEGFFHQ